MTAPPGAIAVPDGERRGVFLLALLVVAAALLVRGNAIGNGFVNYDDPEVRAELDRKGPVDLVTGVTYYAYKPVYFLSLAFDRWAFRDAAWGWHLGNVALFAAAAGVLVLLVHSIFGSRFLAFGAGLLLAVHPVHSESVAWVAERKDALSLLLALLAHLAFRRSRAREPAKPAWGAAALLSLAGLAKGTVWTYAGILVLDEALLVPRPRGTMRRLLPALVVATAGIAFDAWIGATRGPGAVAHDASFLQLAAAMAAVHARYVASLFAPVGLSVDYAVDPRGSWGDPLAWAGVLGALLAVLAVVVGIAKKKPVLAFAGGFWVLGLLPVNNLLPTTAILRADRYLLVPALGLYVGVLSLLLRLPRTPRVALLVIAASALGVLGARRGDVWADSQSLWTDAVAKVPGSAVAWVNRAYDDVERAQAASSGPVQLAWWGRAEDDARRGIEAAGRLRRPELELRGRLVHALALLATGRVEDSLSEANASERLAEAFVRNPWVQEDPSSVLAAARSARGQALLERAKSSADPAERSNDVLEAKKAFRSAVATDAGAADAWFNLGNVLVTSGRVEEVDEGISALKKSLALKPDHVDTVLQLVSALYKRGRDAEAKAIHRAALERLGERRELVLLAASLEADVGDPAEAERRLQRLVLSDPRDSAALSILVRLEKRLGQEALAEARTSRDEATIEKALSKFDAAAKAAPKDPEPPLYAGDALVMLARFEQARLRYAQALQLDPERLWVRNLVARAGTLEAVASLADGREDDAVAAMARVVRVSPPRLDIGYASLDAEVARLLPAAEAVESRDATEGPVARAVLLSAALLVCGDETGSGDRATAALGLLGGTPAPKSRLAAIVSAAHLLRAIVRARRIDLAGAREDLQAIARQDPADPLLRFHSLSLDRLEATARLRIAEGSGDEEGRKTAEKALGTTLSRFQELADSHPGWPGPGLAAAEIHLSRAQWFDALKRLAGLQGEFPGLAAVERGFADVYEAQSFSGGERQALLGQARAALERAERIDPRDPTTALALSQWWRLAGNLEMAAKHALSAASAEPGPGPASKALAAILVERARKALAEGKPDSAKSLSATARRFDPAAAGPDLVLGEEAMRRRDFDAALKAFERGLDKEPASAAAIAALADCLRKRASAYVLWLARYPKPAAKNGVEPDPKALSSWEKTNALARAQALREVERSLRLEPAGEEADKAREFLEGLTQATPEDQRKAAEDADRLYQEGRDLERAGRRDEALSKFREATDRDPDHVPAWWWIAATAFTLGKERDDAALMALARVSDLDPKSTLPVDLLRGRIWARHVGEDPEAAGLARRALERYLRSPAALAPGAASDLALAKSVLDALPKGK